jgi:hypothetical protein
MLITIEEAVSKLLGIVDQLQQTHPKKKFTLDGRLIGDIGEILVEAQFDVKLFEVMQPHHGGVTSDGRQIQIKTTMKDALTFPCDHVPEYYLGIKIGREGKFDVVFNGPGVIAGEAVRNRKKSKTNLHSISVATLHKLNRKVNEEDRIPLRTTALESVNAIGAKPSPPQDNAPSLVSFTLERDRNVSD